MRIDTTLGGLDSAGPSAAAAEAAGYDGVFTGELNSDPFLPLVLAAASTEHIDIGTARRVRRRGNLRRLVARRPSRAACS